MKIAVLGAGVIGVTTAHYLAKAGHEVTVIDRQQYETRFSQASKGHIARQLIAFIADRYHQA